MNTLYVLVVDKAWAKLYKTCYPPAQLTLVYHQVFFGDRSTQGRATVAHGHATDANGYATDANGYATDESTDGELAKSLGRILRVDYRSGKFRYLALLASQAMLALLRLQFAGDWHDALVGSIEELPPRYTEADVTTYLRRLVEQQS